MRAPAVHSANVSHLGGLGQLLEGLADHTPQRETLRILKCTARAIVLLHQHSSRLDRAASSRFDDNARRGKRL